MKNEYAQKSARQKDYETWKYDTLKDLVHETFEILNHRLKDRGSKTKFSIIYDDEKNELELYYQAGQKSRLRKLFSRATTPVKPLKFVCISLGVADRYVFDQKGCDVGEGVQNYVSEAHVRSQLQEYISPLLANTPDEKILRAPDITIMEPRQP